MVLSIIFLVILISVVSAQQPIAAVTYPKQGSILKAGTDAMITWANPTVDFINGIVLGRGTTTDIQPIDKIAGMVPAYSLSYTWKIPANFSSGSDYFFILGQTTGQATAGPFTISSDSSTNNSNSFSTTGSASNPSSSSINNGNNGMQVSINNSNDSGLSGGIIAAIVIPVIILILVVIAIFLYFYKKKEKKNQLPGDTFVLDKSDPRLNLSHHTDFSSIHSSKSDRQTSNLNHHTDFSNVNTSKSDIQTTNLNYHADFSSTHISKSDGQTINKEEEKINKLHYDGHSTDTYCKLFENTSEKNNQNVEYIKPSARY
ncbi:hypothetical protein BJ944DRAFT_228366 [Cunninghamella echinulata]|nr:hypothetical protein BJ944DRAFT_228366 [Cunninghamella echinulata]